MVNFWLLFVVAVNNFVVAVDNFVVAVSNFVVAAVVVIAGCCSCFCICHLAAIRHQVSRLSL